jgi:hypothetical protein
MEHGICTTAWLIRGSVWQYTAGGIEMKRFWLTGLAVCLTLAVIFPPAFPVYAGGPGSRNPGELYAGTVNLSHLNHLQEDVVLGGVEMALTHVYSEYPDYKWVDAGNEGTACVDDASRAVIVYLTDFEKTGNRASLERARKALNFVLYMQAEDGEFYNFIRRDGTVNRDGPTSVKSMGWWAARAMWAMGYGYRVFSKEDPSYAKQLRERFLLANQALQRTVSPRYGQYRLIHGVKVPAWLDGFDAMSNALLGLTEFYRESPLPEVRNSMILLGEGLKGFQLGDFRSYPYGAHMDWSGSIQLWHAWGSSQVMALARAGKVLGRKDWIESARRAADGLYADLLTSDLIKEMAPTPSYYEQIAYGANRMVQGLLAVHEATGRPEYARMAGLAASWFTGNNLAHTPMYDPETGRGYDGIIGPDKINRNAGAESTIEALMAMQAVTVNRWAAPLLKAKQVDRESFRIFEAESGDWIGTPETVKPSSPWTGEALYSGDLIRLENGDGIKFKVDVGQREFFQLEAALEIKAVPKGKGLLAVRVNDRTAAVHDIGGSPDKDFLWRSVLVPETVLDAGMNEVELVYEDHGAGPLILDNLVVRPLRSRALYRLENGRELLLIHDLKREKNHLLWRRAD